MRGRAVRIDDVSDSNHTSAHSMVPPDPGRTTMKHRDTRRCGYRSMSDKVRPTGREGNNGKATTALPRFFGVLRGSRGIPPQSRGRAIRDRLLYSLRDAGLRRTIEQNGLPLSYLPFDRDRLACDNSARWDWTLQRFLAVQLSVLKAKLHQVRITHADVSYEGSFGIDTELMGLAGLFPYERILVADINNGNRLETYVIPEPFGSRRMVLNGAAARLGAVGHRAIIMAFCMVDEALVKKGKHRPRIIRLDEHNNPLPEPPTSLSSADCASTTRS